MCTASTGRRFAHRLDCAVRWPPLAHSKRLQQTAPAGVYLLPSPHSFSLFHGLIFVRKGHYRRAVFAFSLALPATYPAAPPTISFTPPGSDLFHPLIASSGLVDTSRLDWQPNQHSLTHALSYVKKLFYKTEWWGEGEVGRREARDLWRGNKAEFGQRVATCTAWSLDNLSDNGRAMHVTRPAAQHERVWQRIAEQWKEKEAREAEEEAKGQQGAAPSGGEGATRAAVAYLPWFMPGELSLVSREDAMGDALGRAKIVVTAQEEAEWMEEERRRKAEERKQRVEAAAGRDEGERQETREEVAAAEEVHAAQYALDESVTGEEDLP